MENQIKPLDLNGLNNIFWGFILIFLDFNINNFDILPDFLGFIIILVGISKLASLSIYFVKAKLFAVISLILSIVNLFQVNYQIGNIPGWA